MSETRHGDWMDESGACKVCGGEIPYGHSNNCDIYKMEVESAALRKENERLKAEVEQWHAACNDLSWIKADNERLKALLDEKINEIAGSQAFVRQYQETKAERDQLKAALANLVRDCMASDFNEHW